MSQNNNGNTQWKNIAIIFVGLLILWLVLNQLTPANTYRWSGHMGAGYTGSYLTAGPNLEGLLYGLLLIALKVLWVLLLAALILGLYQVFKKYIFKEGSLKGFNLDPIIERFKDREIICSSCKEKLQEDFKFCPNCKTSLKNLCCNCGKDIKAGWKWCPGCGQEQES